MPIEDYREIELEFLDIEQPLGSFYLAKIPHRVLFEIAYFDVRRMLHERDVETYLGIQRPLSQKRVDEIKQFAASRDACFPTNVIISVDGRCAELRNGKLILKNYLNPEKGEEAILYRQIARVIDGQHRIAGLEGFAGPVFEIPVCIFVNIDVADEAFIFSTVNLAQTKVNKSLVYDLYELAKTRSPQKTAHNVAVALDRTKGSPFFKRIKRLGRATPGRLEETITQAAFVESLLEHISEKPALDRDLYRRGKKPASPSAEELRRRVLRKYFVDGNDAAIADIVWHYFDAVKDRWPQSWGTTAAGQILNRTNGVKALMRFFRPAYRSIGDSESVPDKAAFAPFFEKVKIDDGAFNVERFPPGTSGQTLLYMELVNQALGGNDL